MIFFHIVNKKNYSKPDTAHKAQGCLETSVGRLSSENQSYFLGVLEGLYFAQHGKKIPASESKMKQRCTGKMGHGITAEK